MNIRIITEAPRGIDKEEHDKMLASAGSVSEVFKSSRRGRGTVDQRALKARAGTDPGGLLAQLGIASVSVVKIPTQNIKATIMAMFSGLKKKEFIQLFQTSSVAIVKTKTTLGVYIPLSNQAKKEIQNDPRLAREFGFWFYSAILAANKSYGILNQVKIEQLRVDYSSRAFIIYLARGGRGWNNI